MPYLRFAAAVSRIKHTNARAARTGERTLHTDTCELVGSLRLPLLVSGKTGQLIYYVRKYFITSSFFLRILFLSM